MALPSLNHSSRRSPATAGRRWINSPGSTHQRPPRLGATGRPFLYVKYTSAAMSSSRRGNALLRIAGCCWRRDKTELSHHADVIAGRVVIGDFAVSELQPMNMVGLEVFSGRRNAYQHTP